MDIGTRLADLGYPPDRTPPEGNVFDPIAIVGKIVYVSGQVPFDGRTLTCIGKVPDDVTPADATRAAALCAANALRVAAKHLGGFDKIARVVRLTGYVNSTPTFTDQHLVLNGASQLVRDLLGDAGRHARTALGMAQLPLDSTVELDMILELHEPARVPAAPLP